jgi:hypothetical protein
VSKFELSYPLNNLEPNETLPYWRYVQWDGRVTIVEVYTAINKPGTSEQWEFDSTFDITPAAEPKHQRHQLTNPPPAQTGVDR